MRLAVGGLSHESHSFSSVPTTLDDFRCTGLDVGRAVWDRWADADTEIQGMIEAAAQHRVELVPTLMAWAWPAGPVTDEAYDYCVGELVRQLTRVDALDGVLLVLHGAMVCDSHVDPEGDLLAELRRRLGAHVPVVAVLDYHANTTPRMVRHAHVLLGYDTYPHVDLRERGREAVDVLVRVVRGEVRPSAFLAKAPMAPIPQRQATDEEPARGLIEQAHRFETDPRVVCVTVAAGFCYSDVPGVGLSVVVTTDGQPDLARQQASTIVREAWRRRYEFVVRLPSPPQAVAQAMREPAGPVVLVDVGDNIGGGTPGDGTVLLAELLRQNASGALVILADPESVGQAVHAGVGRCVHLNVGAKTDTLHGEPIPLDGTVQRLSDGTFVNRGPMRDGVREDMGRTAVMSCGGVTLVLTERKMPPWNLEQVRCLGIEPTAVKIMVAKAAVAHRAAWGPIAAREIEVDTPGLTTVDLQRLPYRHVPRPMFPFDDWPWQGPSHALAE